MILAQTRDGDRPDRDFDLGQELVVLCLVPVCQRGADAFRALVAAVEDRAGTSGEEMAVGAGPLQGCADVPGSGFGGE